METRANYVLIGLFTLATIVAAFAFVYWFQNQAGTGPRVTYRILFESSVSGLRTGASVLFNGIRVGEIADLQLDPKDPKQVVATASIDGAAAIRADTRVSLDFQGLTGIAAVALRGGDPASPLLKAEGGQPPTLRAGSSATADLSEAARETLRKINQFVDDNQEQLHNTFANLEKFSGSLANNSGKIDSILGGVEKLMGGPDGKGDIPEMVHSIKGLADNLDKRTGEISTGLLKFSNGGLRNLDALITDARKMVADLDRAVINFDRNPSRVIFGGGQPATPEPGPQPRR